MRKKIAVKSYEINNKKVGKNELKVILISDIHFSSITNMNQLYFLKEKIHSLTPNYICITGDLIDNLNYAKDKSLIEPFYQWIHQLGKMKDRCIPVLISIGNHDMTYKQSHKKQYIEEKDPTYIHYLKKLSDGNTYVLNNSTYEDDFVCITGFTQPIHSFHHCKSLDIEKNYYNTLHFKLLNPNSKKVQIALIHSPVNLVNEKIKNRLKNYDLILSGHMHNGMIPPLIDKIYKGNRGIIDPDKKIFPKITRGAVSLGKDRTLIISGGITKLSYAAGIFRYGNFVYPMHIESITITSKK